jgi:amino acid transporter
MEDGIERRLRQFIITYFKRQSRSIILFYFCGIEWLSNYFKQTLYTGYFTNDNDPEGIENATHNTFAKLTWTISTLECVVGCIPSVHYHCEIPCIITIFSDYYCAILPFLT